MAHIKRRSILIIYTGGTIGMITDPGSQTLIPVDFNEISSQLPELRKFDLDLHSYTFNPTVDSSNIAPEVWVKLAELIGQTYLEYDGFVILHGTDTMAYTASMLSFMLENLDKPVILTGSQLPIGVLRTDGKENLLSAIEIAADHRNGQPMVPEVSIFFQNKLFRGNRTTKHNAEYFNAFVSENYPALAETGIQIHYNYGAIHYPVHKKPLKIHVQLDNRLGILKLFPGISQAFVRAILQVPEQRAIILESFGSGNAPTAKWFLDEINGAISKGLLILNITQCPAGRVEPGKYETSRRLHQIGVVNGREMTTEAAITKLMFLFGQGLNRADCISFLERSVSGEITV